MTTQSYTSVIDHSSDAGLRAWGLEFSTALDAAGLVQTADTGQVDWGTVTRAAAGTLCGYEIWRMDDTEQATAPVFFRIDYFTSEGGTNYAGLRVAMGTGSDGAGVLTGTAKTTQSWHAAYPYNVVDPTQLFPTYICVEEGFFGFMWKCGISPQGQNGSFFFCRTSDDDGVPDDIGGHCYWGYGDAGNTVASQPFAYNPAEVAFDKLGNPVRFCLCPYTPASSFDGADYQAYLHYTITPRVVVLHGQCTVRSSEVGLGTTFDVAFKGVTPRTYIAGLGGTSGNGTGLAEVTSNSPRTYSIAMLWE